MDAMTEAYALMEHLSTFGFSVRPNDPCADLDDERVARLIAEFLADLEAA